MDTQKTPQELFGLRLAHVGINASDEAEAAQIAQLFSSLMGLETRETPVSLFSDTMVEIMKQPGRGERGHIGFHVDDIPAAEAWFAARGFTLDESSRRLLPTGETQLIYFEQPIGGFAIHLTQD